MTDGNASEKDELARWRENWIKVCREGNVPQYENIEVPRPDHILHGVRQLASMYSAERLLRKNLEGCPATDGVRLHVTDLQGRDVEIAVRECAELSLFSLTIDRLNELVMDLLTEVRHLMPPGPPHVCGDPGVPCDAECEAHVRRCELVERARRSLPPRLREGLA